MKGEDVTKAQTLLRKNIFENDFLQGEIDGEFGPETMRACKRAKYWLGYKRTNMIGTYGQHLEAQLSGKRKLDSEQMTRRKARLKKAKETPLRVKALNRALKDVGMKEHPANSNICEISKWYGMIGPWCAMSVTRWYVDVGAKHFKRGSRWAYCPYVVNDAVRGVNGLARTRYPKPGDLVLFDWNNDGVADHIGLMQTEIQNNSFRTVEGNTGIGNDSNGGEVMERVRNVSDVVTLYGRPVFVHVAE